MFCKLRDNIRKKITTFSNIITDPERFRLAKDTTFGQRHLNTWSQSSISLRIVRIRLLERNYKCLSLALLAKLFLIAFLISSNQVSFFRQFSGSVKKVDYFALRHGFIMASST